MHLLRRVLSRESVLSQPTAKDPSAADCEAGPSPAHEEVAVSSSPRQPLAMLAPPPLDSPNSFGSECSEEDLPAVNFAKRQRLGSARGSMLSPLARSAFANAPSAAPPGFRPPPIRTVTSLEGPDLWGDVAAIPTPCGSAEEAAAAAIAAGAVPPTPSRARGSAGFRLGGLMGMGLGGHRGQSRFGVPPMSLVSPSLYVGDETAAASPARLMENGITHVLNCTSKPNAALEPAAGSVGAPSIGYLRLDLLDNTSDLPRMQQVLRAGVDFICAAQAQGGTVLVHCHRGISRSCTLAMAYLIETQQRPAEAVFDSLRASRRICDPNLSYWCALHEWEKAVLPAHLHRPRSSSGMRALSTPSPRPLSRAG